MIHIISPHIDDAVLSIGGIMLNASATKTTIKVHYLFTISDWVNPDAKNVVCPETEDAITELRKGEERAVADRLGHQYITYDFLDKHIGEPHEEKYKFLIQSISRRIVESIRYDDVVMFPVGLTHPHHVATRDIGLSLSQNGYSICFYEDLPYAALGRHDYKFLYAEILKKGYYPNCVQINIDEKTNLCTLYESQVSGQWTKDIKNYSYNPRDNFYYERVWKPKHYMFNLPSFHH